MNSHILRWYATGTDIEDHKQAQETMRNENASTMSYVDTYWLLAVAAAIMFVGSFLLKRNEPGKSEHVSVH